MMDYLKRNRIPILIASVQWFITTILQIDRLFFSYDGESKYLLATKALYFCFLVIIWCFGFDAYKKIKSGDGNYIRGFYIFRVYFAVVVVLMLVLWPGTWAWDDLWTLFYIAGYGEWRPWQHILTGAYQDVLLQILPFPGGIILLQNIIISICVAFGVTKLETIFGIGRWKNKFADAVVKILPFLLPPVLMYQFSGYRIGLYVYLEFVMLVMLMGAIKDKEEWSKAYLSLFCILCIIVSTWRTESLFYIPCACILLWFINKKVIPNPRKIFCILMIVIGFFGIDKAQKQALGNANYEIVSLMPPCVELVRNADSLEDAEQLADIDKVVDLEMVRNNPSQSGEALYWVPDVVRTGYTDKDYRGFLKAIVKLSFKYPKVVFRERWNVFIKGTGISELGVYATNVRGTAALFDETNESRAVVLTQDKGWIANSPVFKNIRKCFIYLLGMEKMDGSGSGVWKRLIWNAFIPLVILVYGWFKLLIKRKWYLWGICTAVLIRVPVVILTAPTSMIMYFLSFYFLGYVCLVYMLLTGWSNRNRGRERKK
ncbi:hypothetical protein V1226_22550 [Lachnospiraceae bacterium JLR.KK009]